MRRVDGLANVRERDVALYAHSSGLFIKVYFRASHSNLPNHWERAAGNLRSDIASPDQLTGTAAKPLLQRFAEGHLCLAANQRAALESNLSRLGSECRRAYGDELLS